MRLLTLVALAAVAAGVYHYRGWRRPQRAEEPRISDAVLAERVRAGVAGAASSPIEAEHGPMKTGFAERS